MKMDAMQKRRMWKVAAVHFALTILCIILFYITQIDWTVLFCILQPSFLILCVLNPNPGGGLIDALEIWGGFLGIPVWSICFGWIYVKFTNWLNHFPVLGKKVF
jgi:hypothetical protein